MSGVIAVEKNLKLGSTPKPYINFVNTENCVISLEVIDGYATPNTNLVFDKCEIINNIITLMLKRIPSNIFNCYLLQDINTNGFNVNCIRVIITENQKVISETNFNL